MENAAVSRLAWAAMLLAGLLAVFLLWQFDPNQAGNPFPPCPSRWLTGLYCPGCGATRALHALVHGNLEKALSMNVMFVFAIPLVALLVLHQLVKLPSAMVLVATFFSDARPWAWCLISYAILRNLPWYPFSLLAPG
jgi:hypothetical protein